MASRIILKEPGMKEELWFDPDDTREMCHIPDDILEGLISSAKFNVQYSFDNDAETQSVTMTGTLQDNVCGNIVSETFHFNYQEFAQQLMHVAYTEGKLSEAQLLADARAAILQQLRRDYLNKNGVILNGYESDGFGYIYVGEMPVMTVEHVYFSKDGSNIEVELSRGATVVNLRNAIAPLSARFTLQNGEKTFTVVIPKIEDDFLQKSENGWLSVCATMTSSEGFIVVDEASEAIIRPDELAVVNDCTSEETYQKRIWYLSRLETGVTPNNQSEAIDDIFPVNLFDM